MGSGTRPKSSGGGRALPQKLKKQHELRTKPVAPTTTHPGDTRGVDHAVPVGIQQAILNVFTQAFPVVLQQDDFKKIMQEVKGHLYNRDFDAAFGKQEYLDVYASRWSAARSLAYADILTHPDRLCWYQGVNGGMESSTAQPWSENDKVDMEQHLSGTSDVLGLDHPNLPLFSKQLSMTVEHGESDVTSAGQNASSLSPPHECIIKVVCVGGGAGAEIVALAATSRYLQARPVNVGDSHSSVSLSMASCHFDVLAIDIADWTVPTGKISSALTTCPFLSDYASQATRDANRALLQPNDNQVAVSFSQQDILQMSLNQLRNTLRNVSLVTMMFTLNELFSSSLAKTTALLLNMTEAIEVNAHLVVVDSPGSYSEVKLGKSQSQSPNVKKYPMRWLLDHTLLEVVGKDANARWVKIEDEDSKWYRIDDKLGLRYGIDLENCRYQIHVFRKLK